MKIISYNIQFGRGLDGNVDLRRICDIVKGADLICLQEVESGWERSGNIDQASAIAEILTEYYYVFGSSFDVDQSYRTKDGKIINRRRRHGDMILSRWPIVSSRTYNLPKKHYGRKFNMQMGFVEAVIQTEAEYFRLYNYHAGYLDTDERLQQIKYFSDVFNQSPKESGAWCGKADIDGDDWGNQCQSPSMPKAAIVCGDFNASCDTEEYDYLVQHCELVDCWMKLDPPNINTSTLKHSQTEDVRVSGKIDHIMVSHGFVNRLRSVEIDDHANGSDHKPISCVLD